MLNEHLGNAYEITSILGPVNLLLVQLSADVQHFDIHSCLRSHVKESLFITMFLPHPPKFMKLIPALKG